MSILRLIIVAVFAAVLFACNVKKQVPEGRKLLLSASVEISSEKPVSDESALEAELKDLLRPTPNKKIAGMRVGVWAHNRVESGKAHFLTKFLNKKFGEAPVYVDQVQTEKTMQLIQNRLENRGFFGSKIEVEIVENEKTGRVLYKVFLPEPYVLDKYVFNGDSSRLSKQIDSSFRRTPLKEGTRYDLDKLKEERQRIDDYLKNKGYYNFNDQYLIFRVDTNFGNQRFNLYLSVKKDIEENALLPYKINSVKVFPNYAINDSISDTTAVVEVGNVYFIQSKVIFKPKHLRKYILFKEGDNYNKRRETRTSSRLSAIGTYKYVNIRFQIPDSNYIDSAGYGKLDATIHLSPLSRQALRLEMQALSKSNNFAGPALLASYRNRNLFKGGEAINISGKLGFETQLAGGRQTGFNSYEAGLQTELIYPRVLLPFKVKNRTWFSVPKTSFLLSFSLLNRVQYYTLNSVLASYGYRWNSSRLISHELYVINMNYVKLKRTTEGFREILANNAFLRRSFEQQLIVGPSYTIQYNELAGKPKKNRFLLIAGIDAAGNGIHLVQTIASGPGNKRIFGESYAQYVKLDIDLRHYLQLNKESRLVTRLFAGIGLPGKNSLSLPYIKQYFSGGPNSIRAFRIRSLGPGSYRSPALNAASFFDQSGDIKLEANVEYRFPIFSVVKGAVFADAGNVWLLNDNPDIPGGKFGRTWQQELAAGVGAGIRIDVEFFVIRLDASTPIRKPFLPAGERWVTEFHYGYKYWRRENLIWNFAIGYPF